MKLALSFLLVIFQAVFLTTLFAQPGKDGPMVITAANTVVNCYKAVNANVTAGTSQVIINNAGSATCNFECGDLVMIYQAQGATINTSNTATYGAITNYNNAGLYEFNYVVSVTGTTITVQNPWANNYTSTGRIQLIKVPQYSTLTVNAGASIVPSPWQDAGIFRFGGIVAVHVTGACIVNGTIHANGFGFRPGVPENFSGPALGAPIMLYTSTVNADGGAKGESIAGFNDVYDVSGGRYGRGAPANGGGGGNSYNAGGGGGSNANNGNAYDGNGVMCSACAGAAAWTLDPFTIANLTVPANSSGGGRGGYSFSSSNQNALLIGPGLLTWGGNQRQANGGYGGKPLTTITAANRIFFGGGGGAGDKDNNNSSDGGTGGGIVYIIAGSVTGAGQINANGTNALNQNSLTTGSGNDAPGGGGGGGTVIVRCNVSGVALNANGGKGGDQGFLNTEAEGPGGGGGGGFIGVSSGFPAMNVNGGANGITLSGSLTEFTPNGATSGASGQLTISVPVFSLVYTQFGSIVTTSNSPVCAGSALNFTTTTIAGCTYSWSGPGGFTSAVQNPSINPAAISNTGQFQVIYTTAGGCTDTSFVNAVVSSSMIVTPVVSNPLCSGACTGIITASATSGQAPFNYSWSNGQTTPSINGLCAGPYSVTVTDANGCTGTANSTIVSPNPIVVNVVPTQPSCGVCNGTLVINASGGTGALEYSLNGVTFQASNTFSGVCAGTYNIIVRDTNNCTQNQVVNLTQSAALSITVSSSVPPTCGQNNGSITVTATGGAVPYQYSNNGGAFQASATFASLPAGNYTITVQDANGCTSSVPATIISNLSPVGSILTQNNVSCFGGVNGSVLIGAVGGTAPITYDLNPGPGPQASNSFTGLAIGAYTVVVADANGCTSNVNFTITQPTQLTYTTTPTAATCNGLCNGQITVNPSGGTAPYQFSSNNGLTFAPANPMTGLCAGNVFVVTQDANGCLANSVVVITEPTPVTATFVLTDPICNGSCDGQIAVTASNGTPPYTYSINGGAQQASNIFTGLCAGNHAVMVADANGLCTYNAAQVLNNPPGYTINQLNMSPSNCGFNDGSFEVVAVGGNAPYQYSANGSPNQPTGVFNFLVGGAYQVITTDAIGCQEMIFVGVNDVQMSGMLVSQTDATCFGVCDGTAEAVNTGGSFPISYELDNAGITQPSGISTGLCAGPHIYTLYDAGFCVANVLFTINEPATVSFSTTNVNVACNGGNTGEIHFTGVTGGVGGYSYSIDGGATYQGSVDFTGLAAGTYNVVVQDANLCFATGTVTLTENTAITYVTNINDLTCFNDNTGFLQLVASGGQSPYTHSIDNGVTFSAGFTFVGLPAGNYNVVIQDALGCTVSGSDTVNQPLALASLFIPTAVTCNGVCNGTIQVNTSGGTPPYLYSSNNGTTYQLASLLTNLCAGPHQIMVSDANGCLAGGTQNITQPTAIAANTTVNDATCGFTNGSITITAAGGTPGYTYSIDNGVTYQSSNLFSGLNPATYLVVVQDTNNCTTSAMTTVIANAVSPIITGVLITEPTCNGSCNGSVVITASGGTGTLLYDIGGPQQISSTFAGICASSPTITVIDSNGCADTQAITINEPGVLSFTSVDNNLACFNDFSGSISITATGGTIPYSYSYDNGVSFSSVPTALNLSAGTYDLIVNDVNGCQSVNSVTLTEPAALVINNQNSTDPSCNAFCDGQVTVNVSGGTIVGLHTYIWSGGIAGPSQNTAINVCAGSYTVDISDDNGCTVSTNFTLVDPAPYVITSINSTDVQCFGDCNGTITINAAGGAQFSIDAGVTFSANNTFNNLCPGVYNIETHDAIGCIATAVGIINEPPPIQLISTPDSSYCTGSTVPLFAFAYGGNSPYSFAWSNGVNSQTQNVSPVGNQVFSVIATDANGCVSDTAFTQFTSMTTFTANIAASSLITCPGAPVILTVNISNGIPNYQYNWSNGDTAQSITVTNNVVGTYSVIVNDQCLTYDTLTIALNTFALPQVNFSINVNEGCTPLPVTLTNTTPVNQIGSDCLWTFSDGSVYSVCDSITNVFTTPGCYDVTLEVTSPDGCVGTATQSNVLCVYANAVADFYWNPEEPTAINPMVNFNDLSTLAASYSWNFADLGTSSNQNPIFDFQGQDTGYYEICLQVISPDGCIDDTCKMIHIGDEYSFFVPNSFTPDGDGLNDFFFPVMLDVDNNDYEFLVFDRWGTAVFKGTTPDKFWDGTHKGIYCEEGVYVWKVKLKTKDGYGREYYGHVTLLR